ncbi:hypothetical protein CPLU01_03198 [Colletotrichum plurivorum]|uniref:Uncharacterized protein n=1 Tax=Colletotrichum plurivorum TaxID=2175906 RepID=A0A8H6NL16_9PEZI|nr:hypothetical protein CPLU01_03198 [Colletotrichum plurivorum]
MTSSPPHRRLQNTPIAREADHRSPRKRPEDKEDRPRAMLHAPCSMLHAPCSWRPSSAHSVASAGAGAMLFTRGQARANACPEPCLHY